MEGFDSCRYSRPSAMFKIYVSDVSARIKDDIEVTYETDMVGR